MARTSKSNLSLVPRAATPGSAAFFDLDRTLLRGGSGPVFAATLARIGVETPHIPGQDALFKLFDLFGESFLVMQLARFAAKRTRGLDRAVVQASAEIAADELLARFQPHARALLAEHRERGDTLVLATTSPYDLVAPFARRLGMDAVVATRYEANEGMYTGEIDGPFVWGPGKLAAIRAWASNHNVDIAASAAYSDSVFDTPMLSAVGRPVAVNPDARLAILAAIRRWPIRSFDAPSGVPVVNGIELFDVVRVLARPELLPFAMFGFVGTDNIPTTGPAIIAANHRSYFDPLAIGLAIAKAGRNARFMGKKEVFDAPVVGQFARAMGAIRVDRGTGSDQPLREAAAALAGGEVVVILPQGTIPRGEAFFEPELRGRAGVARLAAMCPDVPVIPMGVWGTENVWPRKSKVPLVWNIGRPPAVDIVTGPPLVLRRSKASTDADLSIVMNAIMNLLPDESRIRKSVSAEELANTVPDGDLRNVRRGGSRPDVVREQRSESNSREPDSQVKQRSSSTSIAPKNVNMPVVTKTSTTNSKASSKSTSKASAKTAKPTKSAKPAAVAKPRKSAKPAVTAKPRKSAKPAVTAKPRSIAATKAQSAGVKTAKVTINVAKPTLMTTRASSVRRGSDLPEAPSRRLRGSLSKRLTNANR